MSRSTAFRTLIAGLVLTLSVFATAQRTEAAAPLGYQLMCLQTPSACKGGGAAVETLSSQDMTLLRKVNTSVNRSIKPKRDRGADVWNASASSSGDCEDYVLAKRRALVKAGISSSALRIAYVKTRKGEGHAILVVKSNRGELVLDNLTNTIKPLSQTGYRLVSMSGANPLKWS